MSISPAEASALYLRSKYPAESAILKRDESKQLEDRGWRPWQQHVFPDLFDCEFLPEHTQFWDWGWSFLLALRDRKPLPPDANAFLDLLSRNFGKSMHCEAFMVAAVCVVGYGIFLYISGSQDLANEHLANITTLLQSDGVTTWYPEHSRPQKSQITGANKAWTQKKITTEGGATVWAIGLLVGVRGIRQGKERVRGFVLDDVDDYDDSPAVALKKANTLASSVLPTSDTDFFVIGAQNLITEHGVFHRIYTKQDMMLAHRVVCGPLKAFENLETEFRDGRDMIIAGESNWPERVTWEVGQRFIDTFGLIRFLAEFQHDFSSQKQGLCLENYDDQAHIITRTEFYSMFGVREVPNRWYKYQAHDHARTKTAFHANVMLTLAVSSMNERFPGFFFIDKPMSFPAQTEADEVAIRFLKSVTPTVTINNQPRLWDELVSSSLHRTNIDSYSHDVTKMIRMRRATLAKIIPPAVGPMLSQKNYRQFRMSHEQNLAAGKVYRDVYGIPAQACNPGAEGGLELFNHFLAVDYNAMHPCEVPCEERITLVMKQQECNYNEALERITNGIGPGGRGFTRTLIIVEDGELEYTAAEVSPERLHDAALLRYQWQHWRYTKPTLNDKGEKEWGPQKMNDDFGNCAMFLFHDQVPQAAPLNHGELVQEYMPKALKADPIAEAWQEDPEKAVKLQMAALMKQKGIEKQLQKRPTKNLVGAYRRFSRGK
jgi:hypothetical protein